MIAATIWEGFVIAKLWAWFVVPVFGLTALTIPVAIGLACLLSVFTYQYTPFDVGEKSYGTLLFEGIFAKFWVPAMALLVAWIATFYL
jgi:hypothetical protein